MRPLPLIYHKVVTVRPWLVFLCQVKNLFHSAVIQVITPNLFQIWLQLQRSPSFLTLLKSKSVKLCNNMGETDLGLQRWPHTDWPSSRSIGYCHFIPFITQYYFSGVWGYYFRIYLQYYVHRAYYLGTIWRYYVVWTCSMMTLYWEYFLGIVWCLVCVHWIAVLCEYYMVLLFLCCMTVFRQCMAISDTEWLYCVGMNR